MRTLAIDEFEVKVHLDRGPIGSAVCICSLPEGRRLNRSGVERALEHTQANTTTTDTEIISSKVICTIELCCQGAEDEDNEKQKLHVETIAEGILSGIVDWLADLGEPVVINSKPRTDEHLAMVQALVS